MYYNFLIDLKKTNCQSVIITGGNHDSPGTLNAPKQILNALSIKVVGKATEEVKDKVFEVEVGNDKVIIGAVPYLRDGDIRRAVEGESFNELTDKYKKALVNHYQKVADYCQIINPTNVPVIAMGHLFALGGSISDSEQNIYVGTLGHIGAEDFPTYFDYIALGHLHRPQIIGDNAKVRYSGSPYILSFSEVGYQKELVVLDIENNDIQNTEAHAIPDFRPFYKIEGTMASCIAQFPNVLSNNYELIPWVEIILDEEHHINIDDLKTEANKYEFEILKTTLKKQKKTKGIEELMAEAKSIKELVPTEVFKLKCEEIGYDIEANPKVWDAFNEVLQAVKEQLSKVNFATIKTLCGKGHL